MWLIQGLLSGEIEWSKSITNIFYSCTECGNCTENCRLYQWRAGKGKVFPEAWKIIKAVKEEAIEKFLTPPKVRDFLVNIRTQGNPYGEASSKRGEWTKEQIKIYEPEDEFLYHVGCVGSYDPEGQQAAIALGYILEKSGISFGILGNDESCDGNEVDMLGERGMFEHLARQNIQKFKNLEVKKIVTLSPHSYNALKNEYPKFGGDFEVFHYTQLLRDLIKDGKLRIPKTLNSKVTYHDPCFLGRHNNEYDSPREILSVIPGIEFVEMDRNRIHSFCCGGGGGNFYTDFLGGGEDSPARIRIREARDTGADILAVACPICLTMFKDALKIEGLEGKLAVKDMSEIVKEAWGQEE